MALHLKHIKEWNALEISLNGRHSGKISSDYYQFLDQIPENEKHHVSQYVIMIPDKYLKSYLEKFEWITTTNQTIKSMLGTEEIILPNTDYELKHLDKMKLKPFPYQEIAAQFILSEQTGIVGDEVGLGKTAVALTVCNELIQDEIINKSLVVVPSSLKYQWKSEIEKFTDYTGMVIDGTKKQREKLYELFDFSSDNFLIIGYETLRNDIQFVVDLKFDCVVLDEAHRISNRTNKTHKAVTQLKPTYRIALTGTPMQNKPEELFGLMLWIDKEVFGGVTKFRKKHIIQGEKFGKPWMDLGYRYLDDIREQVSPKMIRRLKKDVAPDLPDIVNSVVRVDMNAPQKKLYSAITDDMAVLQEAIKQHYQNAGDAIGPDFKKHPDEEKLLGYLYMLQAVSDHPLLLTQGKSGLARKYLPLIRKCKVSPKLEMLIEQIGVFIEQGSKIVIFSQYVRMLNFIKEKIQYHFNQEPYMIYGAIPSKERHEQIEDFNVNPTRNIMLLSDAGNAGLNLQRSDILINYESPWSMAVKIQRNGRIHRINSEHDKVTIMNLVVNDTIDESILKTLERKESLNQSLVESTDSEVNIMNELLKEIEDK